MEVQVSYSYARQNLAKILDDASKTGKSYIITRRKKAVGKIKGIDKKLDDDYLLKNKIKKEKALRSLAGLWKDRKIKDSVAYAKTLREEAWRKK